MAINPTDIIFYLSGGAANTDPTASLGGAISSTRLWTATYENLFYNVTPAQVITGVVTYRCMYVKNEHVSLVYQAAKVWIEGETPSPDSSIDIGLDPSGVGGTATTIALETDAPAGVSFSHPITELSSLSIGDINSNDYQAIWVRRTILADASASIGEAATLRVSGTSNP